MARADMTTKTKKKGAPPATENSNTHPVADKVATVAAKKPTATGAIAQTARKVLQDKNTELEQEITALRGLLDRYY